jgi:hypothetical protein
VPGEFLTANAKSQEPENAGFVSISWSGETMGNNFLDSIITGHVSHLLEKSSFPFFGTRKGLSLPISWNGVTELIMLAMWRQ